MTIQLVLPCLALAGASLCFICSSTNTHIVLAEKKKKKCWSGIHSMDGIGLDGNNLIIDLSIP